MMGAMPIVSEADLVGMTLDEFADRRQIPQLMLRLSGMPWMAQSAALEGRPIQLMTDGREVWEGLHKEFLGYLAAIASNRLSRDQKRKIAEEAHRVRRIIPGDQRSMRPCELEVPDLRASLSFVLHTLVTRQYGQRLARCQLRECQKFYLRKPHRGHPDRYCCPRHAKRANQLAGARRAKDYRARQEAITLLKKAGYPNSAMRLIKAVKQPGLSANKLVRLARAKRKPIKHK
jgi:hypothetical protein